MAGVGVDAARLTGGWLVGAGRALGLGRLAGRGDVVAGVGVEAGGGLVGLAGGGDGRSPAAHSVWADWPVEAT